jgi:hypothetical protein
MHEIPAKPADMSGAFKPLTMGKVTFNNGPSSSGGGLDFSGRLSQMLLFVVCLALPIYFGIATESWLVGICSGVLFSGGLAWLNDLLEDDIGEIVDNIIVGAVFGTAGTAYCLIKYMNMSVSWQRAVIISGIWAAVLTVGYLTYRRLIRNKKVARVAHVISETCRYSLFIAMAGFVIYELHVHGVL